MLNSDRRPASLEVSQSIVHERERQRDLALAQLDTSTLPPRYQLSSRMQALIALLVVLLFFVGLLFWFHLL